MLIYLPMIFEVAKRFDLSLGLINPNNVFYGNDKVSEGISELKSFIHNRYYDDGEVLMHKDFTSQKHIDFVKHIYEVAAQEIYFFYEMGDFVVYREEVYNLVEKLRDRGCHVQF